MKTFDDLPDTVEIEYDSLDIGDKEVSYTYKANIEDVREVIADKLIDEISEEKADKLEEAGELDDYLDMQIQDKFDELIDKYYEELKSYFEDKAADEAAENYNPDDDWLDEIDYRYDEWRDRQLD